MSHKNIVINREYGIYDIDGKYNNPFTNEFITISKKEYDDLKKWKGNIMESGGNFVM